MVRELFEAQFSFVTNWRTWVQSVQNSVLVVCLLIGILASASEIEPSVSASYVFTDEAVTIRSPDTDGGVHAQVTVLSQEGWSTPLRVELHFDENEAKFAPIKEGIHKLMWNHKEVRFLAISPSEVESPNVLIQQLPNSGKKLLEHEPYTILAMGDSVTHTGNYPKILSMLLQRTTGNPNVRVVKRAYPGRSIDASVRNFTNDIESLQPDLVCIMYGLNDQLSGAPLLAYLEQHEWLMKELKARFACDVVFVEPTPHIDIFNAEGGRNQQPLSYLFRTVTFGAALRDTGKAHGAMVVSAFDAIWGDSNGSAIEIARSLRCFYPPHYKQAMHTSSDLGRVGDTIHPNALGHLKIAQAIYQSLTSQVSSPLFDYSAETRWLKNGIASTFQVKNISGELQIGEIDVYPLVMDDRKESFHYRLKPGEVCELTIRWPEIKAPSDLMNAPFRRQFRQPGPYLQVWNRMGHSSRVTAVRAPWEPEVFFPPKRYIVKDQLALIDLQVCGEDLVYPVQIPDGKLVGRMPIVQEIEYGDRKARAVAEFAYTRFASVKRGQITIDGRMDDWAGAEWFPVGDPIQARWTSGPYDSRESIDESNWECAITAGDSGLYFAFRGTGEPADQSVTVYFDPRSPDLLGTVGSYYWLEIKFRKNGRFVFSLGDTSPKTEEVFGCWNRSKSSDIVGEIYVPYEVMGTAMWPESGDLGVSIVWKYHPDGRNPTYLMWAEDGHPWNPRWYGVARLRAEGKGISPYRVRVE